MYVRELFCLPKCVLNDLKCFIIFLHRYTKNLKDAKVIDIKMGLMLGIGIGLMMLTLFSTYALAFWYGSKLVREDEHYTAGNMLVVCVLYDS